MAWLLLIAAGELEVAFASSLKPAEGFTRLGPSVAVVVFGTAAVTESVPSRNTPEAPVRSASTSSLPRASSPKITRAR